MTAISNAEAPGRLRWRRPKAVAVRAVGLAAIGLIACFANHDVAAPTGLISVTAARFGIALVVGFLWLVITGTFGYGTAQRRDWVGIIPFLVALVVREVFTLHSVEEITLQFAQGPVVKHSVVYALVQMFYIPLLRDDHWFTMHLNGVLGAAATLPLYLFVRQRVESHAAGFLCALFLAVHPIVARFAPTDAPYSLLLATWFCGLALLSASRVEPRALLGGGVLLGIAATARVEGLVVLLASAVLLEPRRLLASARAVPRVAIAAILIVALLGALQASAIAEGFLGNSPAGSLTQVFKGLLIDVVWSNAYSPASLTALIWLGALIGIRKRFRLGLCAFIAALIVAAPIVTSTNWVAALHRMVPACSMQAIVAGIGAYSLTAWLPLEKRRRWLATLPGILLACHTVVAGRSTLIERHAYNEEYDIVRTHLAPGGIPLPQCTLMILRSPTGDSLDLWSFAQVVPRLRVVECSQVDCAKELSRGGCFYYLRTTASYFHPDGVPRSCAVEIGSVDCVNEETVAVESLMELEPVEARIAKVAGNVPWERERYPARASLGLFRARPRSR